MTFNSEKADWYPALVSSSCRKAVNVVRLSSTPMFAKNTSVSQYLGGVGKQRLTFVCKLQFHDVRVF